MTRPVTFCTGIALATSLMKLEPDGRLEDLLGDIRCALELRTEVFALLREYFARPAFYGDAAVPTQMRYFQRWLQL